MGKGRAIQRLSGGDIPRLTSGQAVQKLMVFSAGVNCGWKREVRNN
jgi:hypothetical protein